ncbi:target of rapamycin complex subunit lst8-like [Rhopilema esculentum]|uniref:target of rapamycin complex subunit lst8-like n=1 Tax=Rhopilema esculentum TaxID=499914 RepID=UPI0031DA6F20
MGGDQVILATAGYDHTIRFWQAHSGICLRTLQHPDSQVNALEITPDKQLLAAAGYQHIRMYDVTSGNPNAVVNYDGISKNVTAVGFQEDGKWMFTGGEDCSVRIWDLRSRSLQCQHIFQVNSPVNTVVLHQNQGELIVGDQSGAIHMWDLRTDHNEHLIPEPDVAIQSISIDREARFMAAVNNKGDCYVWRLSGGSDENPTVFHPEDKIPSHKKYGLKCLFSPDSTLLATCSADATLKVWRTTDFSLLTTLPDPSQRWVWDCAFSEDSHYIITASSDGIGRLWNTDKSEVIREYSGHQKAIVCLAFRDARPS